MRRADAAPGQAEALVLPQHSVAARGGEEADVGGVEAGSLAGQAHGRGYEAVW